MIGSRYTGHDSMRGILVHKHYSDITQSDRLEFEDHVTIDVFGDH
jgi:hypothetical protein